MRQHTPGPWRMAKGYIDFGAVVADTPCRPMTEEQKAEELDPKQGYGGYIIAESIVKRNRPLIAMAPELLAACEDAHKLLSICRELQGEYARRRVLQAAMDRLDGALADLDELEREVTA